MQTGYRKSFLLQPIFGFRHVLFGAALLYAAPAVSADVIEPEIRCCVGAADVREFATNFAIHLQGDEYPIGHFKLLAPRGAMLGLDEKSGLFHSITEIGVYALVPDSELPIQYPEHHRSNPRVAFLFSLEPGTYSVKVIGQRTGKYTISFRPVGYQEITYSTTFSSVSIKAGEVHTYTFPGRFDDPRDGSIPRSSPSAFRVTRVK